MNEPIIVIKNLVKRFSKEKPPALDHINAEIPQGQLIGIVGPDGAGKTTLLRLIAALLIPTEGSIAVSGNDSVKDAEKIHAISGYMPQKFGLYEDLTVLQNLNLYADLKELPEEEKKEVFPKLLQFTDLARFTDRLAGKLSGGMKQKLGLACCLVKKPPLLILDEPSVGVDPISRRELWKIIYDLLKEGITVLWSTPYLDEAERCQTVLLLNQGKLLYQGPPEEMTARVEGRVFKLKTSSENRLPLFFQTVKREDVVDAIIQGSDIRVVVKEKEAPPFSDAEPAKPRFEDAFIDILGGSTKLKSELAERREPVLQEGTAVTAQDLTKKFGDFTAASSVNFSVKRGEIFGLLGPNGAGKTTIFRMLCGLLHPTAGKALVNGLDLETAPGPARSQIGYMAQKFSLYGILSIQQNLEFFAGAYNLNPSKKDEILKKMIEIFHLEPFLKEPTENLPLGIKQRLSLACANLHDPPILFLDEPTSGVDPITRREFWNHIHGLVEKGVSVLVTTHFMDEAEFCDRIAFIYRGKIIHMDTPDALKKAAVTAENPNPTLEDAFIQLIEEHGKK